MVAMPSTWEKYCCEELRSVIKTTGTECRAGWKTAGQLKMIHGEAEFNEFLARGKWEEGQDDDGDTVYKVKEKTTISNSVREDKATTNKKNKIDEDTYEKLYNAMGAWGSKSGLSLEDLPTTKKRLPPKRATRSRKLWKKHATTNAK